jgi:hypothetical protein
MEQTSVSDTRNEHLADIEELVAGGACDWAVEEDENDGDMITPSDVGFRDGFLEAHFQAIR